MASLSKKSNPAKKWIPAIAVPVLVIAGGAIIAPLAANAAVDLPEKTPTQVLTLLASTKTDAFTGTVQQNSDLGLPSLSSVGQSGSSGSDSLGSILALVTGTHTLRTYVDGPTKTRVQVLDQLAETDVVHNGSDVWVYDSKKNSVEHATLAEKASTEKTSSEKTSTPDVATATPTQLASTLVKALEPSSTLTVGTDTRVAGRPTYTLVLSPKATDTLVGEVAISVDSATGLPLAVSITARGESSPAFSTAFTKLTLGAPDSHLFDFSTPKGATVKQLSEPTHPTKPTKHVSSEAKPTVSGTGWDAIVSLPSAGDALSAAPQVTQLTTAVDGGRLLHTALVNVFIANDGTVYAGSVSAAKLEAAASAK